MSVPGFKVITPATAYDAKGLLKSAIRDDDPVMCFEDTTLWFTRDDIPDEDFLVPLGVADVKRDGSDVTLVAIAGSLVPALAAAEDLAAEGVSVQVIDPRTLVPLDKEKILGAAAKTGRLVIADPAHRSCSAASEIAAIAAEEIFDSLRAPIVRVTTPQTHVPFSPAIEKQVYPTRERIRDALRRITTGVKVTT
jgi:pyruvate dehydrogenase E1 component beta subunit